MMRLAIVTAFPTEDWHSERLIAAAQRWGRATVIDPADFSVEIDGSGALVRARGKNAGRFDAFILARGLGEEGNPDFQIETYRLLERMGKPVVNSIGAIMAAMDKFQATCLFRRAGLPTPKTVVTQNPAEATKALAHLREVVCKPLFGSLGKGVERLRSSPAGERRIRELVKRHGALYMQEYVPNDGRDIRAFVVGDEVAAAIYRVAPAGEWRTNIHLGGTPTPCQLDERLQALSLAACRAVGLDYTGVDILEGPGGPVVLEVNGTPLWQGIYQALGRDMAENIVAYTVGRVAASRGGAQSGG